MSPAGRYAERVAEQTGEPGYAGGPRQIGPPARPRRVAAQGKGAHRDRLTRTASGGGARTTARDPGRPYIGPIQKPDIQRNVAPTAVRPFLPLSRDGSFRESKRKHRRRFRRPTMLECRCSWLGRTDAEAEVPAIRDRLAAPPCQVLGCVNTMREANQVW